MILKLLPQNRGKRVKERSALPFHWFLGNILKQPTGIVRVMDEVKSQDETLCCWMLLRFRTAAYLSEEHDSVIGKNQFELVLKQ